jgi:hypothetical protein
MHLIEGNSDLLFCKRLQKFCIHSLGDRTFHKRKSGYNSLRPMRSEEFLIVGDESPAYLLFLAPNSATSICDTSDSTNLLVMICLRVKKLGVPVSMAIPILLRPLLPLHIFPSKNLINFSLEPLYRIRKGWTFLFLKL